MDAARGGGSERGAQTAFKKARARATAAAAAFSAALHETSGDVRFEAALRRELEAVNAQLAAITR